MQAGTVQNGWPRAWHRAGTGLPTRATASKLGWGRNPACEASERAAALIHGWEWLLPQTRASYTRRCGNFGLLLLDIASGGRVSGLLATMLRVTMARGAQSAGLVTYDSDSSGTRKRVVNGKRTDLCDLLMRKFAAQLRPSECLQFFRV